jgi:hypothetical protein
LIKNPAGLHETDRLRAFMQLQSDNSPVIPASAAGRVFARALIVCGIVLTATWVGLMGLGLVLLVALLYSHFFAA